MASKIDIINRALSRVHAAIISSLDDDSMEADIAKREWDAALETTLRAHNWGFAGRTVALSRLAVTPEGAAFAYALPDQCLMLRRVYQPGVAADDEVSFRKTDLGGITAILTDINPATAEYTAKISNTELFDPQFTDALTWQLASVFALSIKSDTDKAGAAIQMFDRQIKSAATQNAREDGYDDDPVSSFERARYA